MCTEALSPTVKRPGSETDHSPPSSAEAKNGRAIPSLAYPSPWRDVYFIKYRDIFTFLIFIIGRTIADIKYDSEY
jgi:hypothetical protein